MNHFGPMAGAWARGSARNNLYFDELQNGRWGWVDSDYEKINKWKIGTTDYEAPNAGLRKYGLLSGKREDYYRKQGADYKRKLYGRYGVPTVWQRKKWHEGRHKGRHTYRHKRKFEYKRIKPS